MIKLKTVLIAFCLLLLIACGTTEQVDVRVIQVYEGEDTRPLQKRTMYTVVEGPDKERAVLFGNLGAPGDTFKAWRTRNAWDGALNGYQATKP